jgi:radical SAM superfamily enzyme YgiQ (UPF0313 family)
MTDIVFLTLPRLELRAPITAPAILKAMVEQHGFSAFCYDLNLDLWHSIDTEKHGHVWFDTDLTFRYEDKFEEFWNEHIEPCVPKWLATIQSKNPKWIGITIFSQRSKWVTIRICKMFREKLPNVKIVVGGPFAEFTGPSLYKNNLTDAYVIGEGEEAIVNILNGNLNAPGINGIPPSQINDLDTIPIPDYSDFPMDKYPSTWFDPRIKDKTKMGTEFVYITGSRGCVRKCTFCDIQSVWPKFRYRSGKSVAEEMQTQNNAYGSKRFLFTDSLLNGSVKQLKDICTTLIDYKDKGTMSPVLWQGQFIARPEHQMKEDVYRLMYEAGLRFVSIGVESGSEKIRDDMRKMFNDEAMDFTFRMCAKYKIEMAWLLLVGYPTETEEEFQKTLDMLEKYNWINQQGLIRSVALGPTLDIVPGSPLWNKQKELGITWDQNDHWIYKDNTREVRIRRWLTLKEKCLELNYPIVEKATDHLLAELEKITAQKQQTVHIYDHYNEGAGAMGPSV